MPGLATELEFYDDAYRTETTAWVDGHTSDDKGRVSLFLSNTVFHPHGGGQKGDRGHLILSPQMAAGLGCDQFLPIIDTRKYDAAIAHVTGVELDPEALDKMLVGINQVPIRIDWGFRYRQMRLHSTAHLLHCVLEQLLGRPVTPPETSDLQDDYGLNRYEIPNLVTPEQMADLLKLFNAFAHEDHQIQTYPDETVGAREGARLWECNGWRIPCGGTHPHNTLEIGDVTGEISTRRGRTSMTFRVP